MERIKNLNRFQKGILLFLAVMILVFGVIYSVVSSRVGYSYMEKIFVPETVDGNTVYSGTLEGKESCFVVTPEKEVTFHHGDQVYGPYTAKEDPAAIPEDEDFSTQMTGVEVKRGDEIIFRGGILKVGNGEDAYWLMFDEKGNISNLVSYAVMSDGTMIGDNGEVIDPVEPSVSHVLDLMNGPELTHKGQSGAWFGGIFISFLAAVSILFADEMFRWNLMFRVENVEQMEPSDWEIASRHIGWLVLTALAGYVYILGLQ